MVLAVSAGVVNEPAVLFMPGGEEVHEVLPVDDHVTTEVALEATNAGVAETETVGAAGAGVVVPVDNPPPPLQAAMQNGASSASKRNDERDC